MANALYNILIFDVYNLWYRVMWENDEMTSVDGKKIPLNAICKFFEMSDSYIKKYGTSDCVVFWLFDNAKSAIVKRKFLDKNYKKNRKEMPQEFYDGLNMVELILKFYRDNSFIYRKQGYEADDFVLPIIDKYVESHDKVIVFSTDMDWSRCLLEDEQNDVKVVQYTRNNEILTVKSFEEKYGFKPTTTNVTFWKTIYGDPSDNILPTLGNFPKEYFLNVINKYSHIDQFIRDALDGRISYLDGGWKIRVKQLEERMRLNWNLISNLDISDDEMELWKMQCSFKPNKLLVIYSALNVVGRFDMRVKFEDKKGDIWQMLGGENLNRAD